MRLILVRHGQTPSNVRHLLDTAVPGPGLTALGATQAAALPAALAGVEVDAIYASNLVRAQQTAAPLARALGLPVRVRPGLREIAAGDLEMRADAASAERYLSTVFGWATGDRQVRMPGGENGTEVLERFDRVVGQIADSGSRTAVVVSHGAMIRVWAGARAHNLDPRFTASHGLDNTAMVVLEADPPSGWVLTRWAGAVIGAGAPVGADEEGASRTTLDPSAAIDPGPR
jgi:broad specificity phosphatase PhoE